LKRRMRRSPLLAVLGIVVRAAGAMERRVLPTAGERRERRQRAGLEKKVEEGPAEP
jgi:hypothetical protein